MVSNIGEITDLAATPSKGLVDGTDKLHSGIIKVLESFSQDNMCVSHAGFTITDGGDYTQYNLAQPIKFRANGQYVSYTGGNLAVAYSSTVQDSTNSRYDWVLLNPNIGGTPAIVIVQGTAGTTPLVSDITAGYIPIALVHISAGADNDKFDYSFQTFTMNLSKNSLSIGHDASGYTESGKITGDADSLDIVSTPTNSDINITPNGTGDIKLGTLAIDGDQTVGSGQNGHALIYTHSNAKAALSALPTMYSDGDAIAAVEAEATLNLTGDVKITSSSNGKPTLTLENTAGIASAANEPEIIFDRTGASDATTSGDLGRILWKGKDDGSNTHIYLGIHGEALDETGGTEDGRIRFTIAKAGGDGVSSSQEYLRMAGGEGVVFNHNKENIDFAVMGDTNDNVLFVDAGVERVGIGTNAPTQKLGVSGAIGAAALVISVLEITGNPLPSAGLTANPNTGQPCLALSSETHRTIIADTQAFSPHPAPSLGPLSLLLPAASGTHQGWEMRIISKANAGGGDNLTLDVTGSSDLIVDAQMATIGNQTTGFTLATGKIYTVIHINSTMYMCIILN